VFSAVEAGKWWDVVAVDGDLGAQTAAHLRTSTEVRCGPVAVTRHSQRWYFLTPAGTAEGWCAPDSQGLGHGNFFGLPGSLTVDMWPVRWAVPPRLRAEPSLICPAQLRQALNAARPVRGVS